MLSFLCSGPGGRVSRCVQPCGVVVLAHGLATGAIGCAAEPPGDPLSVVAAWLEDMRQRYAARAGVSNTCSTRVSTFLGCRARNRTHVLSDTCSTPGRSRVREMEDSMSAAVAWDLSSRGQSARPQLRLVPTGRDVRPAHLRLSRRGRLAVTLVVAAAVLAADRRPRRRFRRRRAGRPARPPPSRPARPCPRSRRSSCPTSPSPTGWPGCSWSTTSAAPRSTPGRPCCSLPPADRPLQGQGPPWSAPRAGGGPSCCPDGQAPAGSVGGSCRTGSAKVMSQVWSRYAVA